MTVGELIDLLSKQDPGRVVVMAIDPEGNGYQPLSGHWIGAYAAGEVGLESLTEADRKRGYDEEDVLKGRPALILTPGY